MGYGELKYIVEGKKISTYFFYYLIFRKKDWRKQRNQL